jgi:hypothetical protein
MRREVYWQGKEVETATRSTEGEDSWVGRIKQLENFEKNFGRESVHERDDEGVLIIRGTGIYRAG